MQFVPWRHVADWKCTGCGDCCRLYSVVINFHEWLKIAKSYGVEHTAAGLDKLFLKRRSDGSCVFLQCYQNGCSCGLQYMKPKACQLWPFKILTEPKYGFAGNAKYGYGERQLYAYVDSACNGIRYGSPTWEFANQTLREFIEIAMSLRVTQFRTTGNGGHPISTIGIRSLMTQGYVWKPP
jgi:Fe-S-cluster containining protein